MLVPMYFLIGIWGGGRRLYSAIKFFLYTLVGSVVMLLGILALYFYSHASGGLAAVMLKMGTYGFLRFSLPILPDASRQFVPLMAGLAIVGIIYGALLALAQSDWKRLIAYSSVSHMGMAMLGIFALTPVGITGSIVHQLNHGISTGALFLIVGVVYERRHTREISEYGGLSKVMPMYAAVFAVMMFSSIGLPALNGFVGELLILQAAFVANKMWAVVAGSGIVLGAAYMLWLFQRTMLGKIENPKNEGLKDLNVREFATFAPLIVMAVWIGIYPTPFLDRLDSVVNTVVARVHPEYLENTAVAQADCDKPKPEAAKNPFTMDVAPCAPGTAPEAGKTTPATVPAGQTEGRK